ncbi:hypothetical protein HYQ45_013922 [Verticillium longisporum]|uniref:Uncharacterized protein n=1 Tax=Verticillium longisporum TaxID=100787 RepID=A0A8I2ZAZ3_VERLO|nr:hypothetical protein HYQ45_013922 [Verticillium longisporum]
MGFTMKLKKTSWDDCVDLVARLPDHTGTFVNEGYRYFLTLPEIQPDLYSTDIKFEKDYYDLWEQLLPRIVRESGREFDAVLMTIEPLCQDALKELEEEEKNFGHLCSFLKQMIRTIDDYSS